MLKAAVLAAALLATPAAAMDYSRHQRGSEAVLLAQDEIKPGESERFADAIRKAGVIDEIWFHSPGGSYLEGIKIGRLIRSQGLATRIPPKAICASACVYGFIGGVMRRIDDGGRLGVHMFSMSRSPEVQQKTAQIIREKGEQGAEAAILFFEQFSANAAAEQARFLVEMSVSLELMTPTFDTRFTDMHWLTPAELKRYNLVNVR